MKKIFALMAFSLFTMLSVANDIEVPPAKEAVEKGVEDVLATITGNINEAGGIENIDAFIKTMTEQLKPVIGFQRIAAQVMGGHYKKASREQKIRFIQTFTRSMVQTYAIGMASFAGYDVVVVPSKDDKKNTYKNTRIYLNVISPEGQEFPMVQSLYFSKRNNGWLMQNIEFNGINLGIMFQNQFKQIMLESGDDIDLAIAQWERSTSEDYQKANFRGN